MAAPRDPVKELDNKFGPGKWQWKPIKDQVKVLVATVGDWGTKGTEIEKKVRLKFESWVKEHHGAEDRDRVSLAEFLNCMIKDKVEAVKKAQKEMGKVGIIKKSSARGKLRAAEGDVAELRMLKVAFLGILPEMVTQRKEEVSSEAASTSDTSEKEVTQPRPKQEEAAGLAPPPPYNPECKPHNPFIDQQLHTNIPAGNMMPVVTIHSGTVTIEQAKQQPQNLYSEATEELRRMTITTEDPANTDPFAYRKQHECPDHSTPVTNRTSHTPENMTFTTQSPQKGRIDIKADLQGTKEDSDSEDEDRPKPKPKKKGSGKPKGDSGKGKKKRPGPKKGEWDDYDLIGWFTDDEQGSVGSDRQEEDNEYWKHEGRACGTDRGNSYAGKNWESEGRKHRIEGLIQLSRDVDETWLTTKDSEVRADGLDMKADILDNIQREIGEDRDGRGVRKSTRLTKPPITSTNQWGRPMVKEAG
ncbi:hypothetical protein MHYP_G00005210 [Metynnis hypsauchen]